MNVHSAAAVLMVLFVYSSFPSAAQSAPISGIEATGRSLSVDNQEGNLPARPVRNSPFVAKLKDFPEVPKQFREAVKLLKEGRLGEATRCLGGNRKQEPIPQSEWIQLYLVFDDANLPAAARSFLDKAVVEYPADPEPWAFIGEIAIDENRFAEAENDFNRAKQLMADYKNTDYKPRIEKRAARDLAEIAKVRNEGKKRQP